MRFLSKFITRSKLDVLVLTFTSLCIEIRQPVQRSDAGEEAVLAPLRAHKPGYALQAPADRALGDGKSAGAVVGSGDQVLLVAETREVAVVMPLRFDELELPGEVCSHPEEHDPA